MERYFDENHLMIRDMVRDFAQNEIKPVAIDLDKQQRWEDRVPWDLLKKGSQLGFRTFVLSEQNGGSGLSDHLTSCLVAEELAADLLGGVGFLVAADEVGPFLTAGGLVMEMGGANSHGAVVAREYGIPAVVGVREAVTRIRTGERITVDGSTGAVTALEDGS